MAGNKKTEIKSRIGFNRTNGNPAFIRSSLVHHLVAKSLF